MSHHIQNVIFIFVCMGLILLFIIHLYFYLFLFIFVFVGLYECMMVKKKHDWTCHKWQRWEKLKNWQFNTAKKILWFLYQLSIVFYHLSLCDIILFISWCHSWQNWHSWKSLKYLKLVFCSQVTNFLHILKSFRTTLIEKWNASFSDMIKV